MGIRAFVLFLFAIACAQPAIADEPPPITTEELVGIALRDNPELIAMRAGALAAESRAGQARALPDPRFTFGWMGEHLETVRGPQTLSYGLSQEIPFFGKRGLRGEVAARAAGSLQDRVRAMELTLAAEVRQLAAEIIYLDQALAIQREDVRLLDEIGEITGTRYVVGRSQLQEVARIKTESAASEQVLLELRRDREVVAAELNRRLGRDVDSPLASHPHSENADTTAAVVGAVAGGELLLALGDRDSLSAFGDLRPEVHAAEEAIAQSDATLKLARRSYLPDFMLGAEYLVVDRDMSSSPEAGTNAWMIELGINLPIWFGKLGAGVREARSMQSESRALLAAERARVATEIAIAAARSRQAAAALLLHEKELLPQAELAFGAARSSYRSGGIGFLDLLASERTLVRARLATARARADIARAHADLARATAQPLPIPEEVLP